MKAKELMIGDWVQLFPDQCRVDGIICLREEHTAEEKWMTIVHLGGNKYERVDVDILEPIPLTHEILEKNGFVCVEVGDNGIGTPAKFRNRFEKWECRTQWHTFHVFYDRIRHSFSFNAAYSNHIEGMQYVHELQHALRISGIDKEVEL